VNRFLLLCAVAAAVFGAAACAEVGTGPEVPASIELPPFAFPTVVVGDTLRDENGVVAPIRAIVRNARGEELADARPSYLYADFLRDTAFLVDTTSGVIVARKAVAQGRIAARIGSSLQVIRNLIATVRPDTARAGEVPPELVVSLLPDTGRARAEGNTTREIPVLVRNLQGSTPAPVQGWLVRFRLVKPANPDNDTTQVVFLVDDQLRPSTLDTTGADGSAGRRVRVRAAQFPVPNGNARVDDTVVVEATLRYKGQVVPGAPVRLIAPVIRPEVR